MTHIDFCPAFFSSNFPNWPICPYASLLTLILPPIPPQLGPSLPCFVTLFFPNSGPFAHILLFTPHPFPLGPCLTRFHSHTWPIRPASVPQEAGAHDNLKRQDLTPSTGHLRLTFDRPETPGQLLVSRKRKCFIPGALGILSADCIRSKCQPRGSCPSFLLPGKVLNVT